MCAMLAVSLGQPPSGRWARIGNLQSPRPLLKAEGDALLPATGSPKSTPGKCQVPSWGFLQKSPLMITAFRGDATARLASERRRRQVLHL